MNETMTVMPFKTILLCLVSSIGFTACSTLSSQAEQPLQQLQLVQNIDALPDTKTNAASLNKYKNHCMIQFTGYFDGGQSTESWEFKGNQLSRAFSETYQYMPNRLFNATTEKPVLDQKTRKTTVFDIQKPEVKHNFDKLKSYFNQTVLDQCG